MTLRSRLLVALLLALGVASLPGRAQAQVSNWQKGVTLTTWWYNEYSSSNAMAALDKLKSMNVEWVTILPTWFVSSSSSNTIYEDVNGSSASDASVRACIRAIHARGMKCMLKPHVDSKDGTWRGALRPSSASSWFSSYRDFIVKWATVAQQEGVEQLAVGTELKSLTGSSYTSNWRTVVAAIRGVYGGKLTYASNWDEYGLVQWWDALDYIGVDAYFPLASVKYPTVSQAKAGWTSWYGWGATHRWLDELKAASVKWNKKVIFTESGFRDCATAADEWYMAQDRTASQPSQANCYEATFQAMETQSWMIGFHWWDWRVSPGSYTADHPINNKQVVGTITDWYGRSSGGTQDTTAPSTPGNLTTEPMGTSSIKLNWSASTDNVGVAGYNVYRNGAKVGSVNALTHTDSGLSAATTYSYRISAYDAAGNESAQSTAVSATTANPADTSAPSVPAGLTTAPASTTQVKLTWNASTDNVGVAGYYVYRNSAKISTVNVTSFTDSGLQAATAYTYQVCAFDAAGNDSALTAAVNGTTASATATSAYDFENGTQGWVKRGRATSIWQDTTTRYQGVASLGIALSSISNKSSQAGQVEAQPASTLIGGKTVTFQVLLAANNTNVRASAYVQDSTWKWTQGAAISLRPNAWTQISVAVPSTAGTPLNRIGVLLFTGSGSFTGRAFVDDVRWDGVSTPPPDPDPIPDPTPDPTPTANGYDFEAGVSGWVNRARCTGVASSTAAKYAGAASLGATLSSISNTSGTQGQVEVQPNNTLVPGKTVTMQVYLASSATNVMAAGYVQDGGWRWNQSTPLYLKPNAWTQVTVTVPAGAATPLNRLGLLLFTSSGSFSGQVYVDEVRW